MKAKKIVWSSYDCYKYTIHYTGETRLIKKFGSVKLNFVKTVYLPNPIIENKN